MLEGKDYIVLDNLVPKGFIDALHLELYGKNHWAFSLGTLDPELQERYEEKDWLDSPMLNLPLYTPETGPTHLLFQDVRTIFNFLEYRLGYSFEILGRVKANLTWPQPHKTLPNPPHIDVPNDKFYSMVFYVNESDGDTIIYDKTLSEGENNLKQIASISPQPGRAVIFKSNRFHSSSPPKNNPYRIIINSVFTPKVP